jgi:hypothetical protein
MNKAVYDDSGRREPGRITSITPDNSVGGRNKEKHMNNETSGLRGTLGMEEAKKTEMQGRRPGIFQLIMEPLIGPPPEPLNDEELIVRSTRAYRARCSRKGFIFDQPNKGLSRVDRDIIFLRNCKGVLARYWWTDKGLRFVTSIKDAKPKIKIIKATKIIKSGLLDAFVQGESINELRESARRKKHSKEDRQGLRPLYKLVSAGGICASKEQFGRMEIRRNGKQLKIEEDVGGRCIRKELLALLSTRNDCKYY